MSAPMQPDLPAAASLVDQLDRKVMVVLLDGRHLVGIMRSVDQFSNVVLENTFERRTILPADGPPAYGDFPLGLFLVRGDAVVLLGEVSEDLETEAAGYPRHVSTETIEELESQGVDTTDVSWDIEETFY
ncbi:hypothetical protein M885DRAFT_550059 [Pelagophyceae sp. CCMP2097]|nr:hypothetical protein M885DRAFT_550059 [Pelagophyceae sp. CCMP2097]